MGYTSVDVDKRVAQQYPTKRPDGSVPYKIVLRESAMFEDGSAFDDHAVHAALKRRGIQNVGGEWFRCSVNDVQAAIIAVRNHILNEENRTQTFKMRPEQEEAVNRTIAYYKSSDAEDYAAMAGLQASSMVAAAPKANDVPDRPYFVNIDVEEEDEPKPVVVAPKPIAMPKKKEEAKPVAVTPNAKRPQTTPLTPTYRPSFVPPTPEAPVVKKEEPKVDLSKVSIGCTVTHKAFGAGVVTKLETAKICVMFGKTEKTFQFPAAFYSGFLKIN